MQTRPIVYFLSSTRPAEFDCNCACPVDYVPRVQPVETGMAETDCNCACPADYARSSQLPELPRGVLLQAITGQQRQDLPGGFQTVFNPFGPVPVSVLNRPAVDLLDRFKSPVPVEMEMETEAVRALYAAGLLRPACAVDAPSFAQPALTVWLHLTEHCNLHCLYCYAPREARTMTPDTGRAAVQAVFRSAVKQNFRMVKLKYAGGEPTLVPSLVRLLHAEALLASQQSGLRLAEVLLSNGSALSSSLITFLLHEKIGLMLSMDGVGAAHDRQRAAVDGRGSFQRVEAGLDRALQAGLRPHLSITVTSLNVHHLVELVEYILARGLTFSLNFYRSPARRADDPLYSRPAGLISAVQSVFALLETRQPETSLSGCLDLASLFLPREAPCGLGNHYLAVTPGGQVAACQMDLDHPVSDVRSPDALAQIQDKYAGENLTVDQQPGCTDCTWRYWCGGGCPHLRTQGNRYCQVYQALLPNLVRLEGLRVLRAAQMM